MKLALKIDCDTLRGTREGVPRLAEMCLRSAAQATFLFSVGPDHTGRALRRAFRPGFIGKVRRTSVLHHYGLKTCLYGTVLPGPDIGHRSADIMRAVRDAGFETGVHTWDHVLWQDNVATRDPEWTRRQLRLATDRYAELLGAPPVVHGAAGWQMNDAAFLVEAELGYRYASDTRGGGPFLPRVDSKIVDCLQLPTTLPTLDELIGREDLAGRTPVQYLLQLTNAQKHDHVYTLHAELEGQRLESWLQELLIGWRAQGYELVTLGRMAASIDRLRAPIREVRYGPIPGRSGTLALSFATATRDQSP